MKTWNGNTVLLQVPSTQEEGCSFIIGLIGREE